MTGHTTLGYVHYSLSSQFLPASMPAGKIEHGIEFNAWLNVLPMIDLHPMIQYYSNVGGRAQGTVVLGFRTKVEL